jgi:cell wall-associated NlpC family hydrolase
MHPLAESAMKYVGVRWRHQGRNRSSGLDCLGLLIVALEDLGFDVEDCTSYDRRPDDRLLLSKVSSQLDRVDKSDIQSGDVILLHFQNRNKSPYHFAIVTENGRMVHGYGIKRKVVVDMMGDWADNIHSVFRLPKESWPQSH